MKNEFGQKRATALGEVFGFPIDNASDRAKRYRNNKLCPYNNIVSNCTKNSIEFPLGVCSLNHKDKQVIICPIRFREDWTIISVKGKFMLTYDDTPEIRQLANKYNLQFRTIPMKTTLHYEKNEIIISDNFSWWTESNFR